MRTILNGAILGLVCTACGCGSTGVVTRGQEPHGPAQGQYQSYHSPAGAVHDHFSGQQTSYYTDGNGMMDQLHQANCQADQQGGYGAESCPPSGQGGYGGTCPHGYHAGGCRSCGHGRAPDWYPKHHRTYSYSVPNDLSYPTQGSVGGAVVYPYYTHKGPSDFFRQK